MIEFGFIGLALALGFKHSFDADHLIAVSTVLRKPRSVQSAIHIGIAWAIGHMLTATIFTIALFFFRENILSIILPHFEAIAGIMLVLLGIWSLADAVQIHRHGHRHSTNSHEHWHLHPKTNAHKIEQSGTHEHRHMLGIGVVQGLAGNDELLILLTASLGVASLGGLLLGVGVFSIGVILGMVLFSIAFSFFKTKMRRQQLQMMLAVGVGLLSVGYGAISLLEII